MQTWEQVWHPGGCGVGFQIPWINGNMVRLRNHEAAWRVCYTARNGYQQF